MVESVIASAGNVDQENTQIITAGTNLVVVVIPDTVQADLPIFVSDDFGETWTAGDDLNNIISWTGNGSVELIKNARSGVGEFSLAFSQITATTNQHAVVHFDVDSSGNVSNVTVDQITSYADVSRTNPTSTSVASENLGDMWFHVEVEAIVALDDNNIVTELWHFDSSDNSYSQIDSRLDGNTGNVDNPTVCNMEVSGRVIAGWEDIENSETDAAIADGSSILSTNTIHGAKARTIAGSSCPAMHFAYPNPARTVAVASDTDIFVFDGSFTQIASASLQGTAINEEAANVRVYDPQTAFEGGADRDVFIYVMYIDTNGDLVYEVYDELLNLRSDRVLDTGMATSQNFSAYCQTDQIESDVSALRVTSTDAAEAYYTAVVYHDSNSDHAFKSVPHIFNDSLTSQNDTVRQAPGKILKPIIGVIDIFNFFSGAVFIETVGVVDDVSKETTGAIMETVGVLDDVNESVTLPLSDVIGVDVILSNEIRRELVETVGIVDDISKEVSGVVIETIGVRDNVDKSVTLPLSDVIGVDIVLSNEVGRELSETVGIIDGNVLQTTKRNKETISITDDVRQMPGKQIISDIAIEDSIFPQPGIGIVETISPVDTISKRPTLQFAEVVGIIDNATSTLSKILSEKIGY